MDSWTPCMGINGPLSVFSLQSHLQDPDKDSKPYYLVMYRIFTRTW